MLQPCWVACGTATPVLAMQDALHRVAYAACCHPAASPGSYWPPDNTESPTTTCVLHWCFSRGYRQTCILDLQFLFLHCLTCAGMEMRSPLSSVSSLLSSSSVFMLSIHSVSTGPSNRIHFWSGLSSLHTVRMMRARIQSCQSCVASSKEPYSSLLDRARGLMTCTWTCSSQHKHLVQWVKKGFTPGLVACTCTCCSQHSSSVSML